MVEYDASRIQAWVEMREEQKQKEIKPVRSKIHLSVVAVQSVACCVVVLLVMLLRAAGGDAYHSLQSSFHKAMARNEWASALALFLDGDPLQNANGSGVKEEDFTGGETALQAGSAIKVAAIAPITGGTLTSGYGERIHPIDGGKEFHTGVDIAAPLGTDLLAVYDGVVIEVGEEASLGKFIRLRHDGGVEILYGHCEEIVAPQGAAVRAGERVALVGSTGVSTGSHVHLRVELNGTACDPVTVLPLEQYA